MLEQAPALGAPTSHIQSHAPRPYPSQTASLVRGILSFTHTVLTQGLNVPRVLHEKEPQIRILPTKIQPTPLWHPHTNTCAPPCSYQLSRPRLSLGHKSLHANAAKNVLAVRVSNFDKPEGSGVLRSSTRSLISGSTQSRVRVSASKRRPSHQQPHVLV